MEQPQIMTANGTILVASIVKIDGADNNSVLACGSNEKAFGVAHIGGRTAPIPDVSADPPQAAIAGDSVEVYTLGKTCLCRAGGAITAGADIKSGGATGAGVVCTDAADAGKEYSVGQALEGAADGEYFKLLVNPRVITNLPS